MGLQDFIEEAKCRKLRGHLINTERNKELLSAAPHREFLDLSLVYAIELPSPGAFKRVTVLDNNSLTDWEISETDLYELAYKDLERGEEILFERMDAVIGRTVQWETSPDIAELPLYVLTNQSLFYGAVQMLNKKILRTAADTIGTDYIILPSSIHELILVSADWGGKEDYAHELADIVYQVNETQVPEPEILSYHVYRYSRANEEITIAA